MRIRTLKMEDNRAILYGACGYYMLIESDVCTNVRT